MVYITGDMHGVIERFSDSFLPNESEWDENDCLIVCGDFGFIFFNDDKEKEHLDMLEKDGLDYQLHHRKASFLL